jgi:hypothetical protein
MRAVLVFAALAAVALGGVACGDDDSAADTTSTVDPPVALPTAAQVRGALLTAADLGTGWTLRRVPAESDTLCGVAAVTPTSPVRGRTGFQRGGTGPSIVHRFVGFPPGGAVALMSAVRDAVATCTETTAEASGRRVTWVVRVVEAPPVGDEAAIAVRLTTGDAGGGLPAEVEEVIFRRGEFVGAIAHAATGSADHAITLRAARAADRRLLVLAGG